MTVNVLVKSLLCHLKFRARRAIMRTHRHFSAWNVPRAVKAVKMAHLASSLLTGSSGLSYLSYNVSLLDACQLWSSSPTSTKRSRYEILGDLQLNSIWVSTMPPSRLSKLYTFVKEVRISSKRRSPWYSYFAENYFIPHCMYTEMTASAQPSKWEISSTFILLFRWWKQPVLFFSESLSLEHFSSTAQ